MNFVLCKQPGSVLVLAAELFEPKSGRKMDVYTTEPGLQLYTGDYLDGSLTGSENVVLSKNMGVCLEAQHFSDTPNKPGFPSTTLRPGEIYIQVTSYRFSTQ